MTLKNGKFYNSDGQVVPLEFGNKEQIDIIQKYEREERELKEGCMLVFDPRQNQNGSWTLYSEVECLCGHKTPVHETCATEAAAYHEIDGTKVKCVCGRKYSIDLHDYGYYVLKLRK